MKRRAKRSSKGSRGRSNAPLYVAGAVGLGLVGYMLYRSRAAIAAALPAVNVRTVEVPQPDGSRVLGVAEDLAQGAVIGGLDGANPPSNTPARAPTARTLQNRSTVANYPYDVTDAQRRAIVSTMQRQLTALGFRTAVDGVEGANTLNAERAFVAANGLPPSLVDSSDSRDRRDTAIIVDNFYRTRMHLPAGANPPART